MDISQSQLKQYLIDELRITNGDQWLLQDLLEEYINRGYLLRTGPTGSDVRYSRKPNFMGWDIYAYGNSYAVDGWVNSTDKHYLNQFADEFYFDTLTRYAVSGTRISDVLSGLINQSNLPALTSALVAGALWPGTSARQGLVVLDSLVNDVGHYPAMNVNPVIPAAIVGTDYRNGLKGMYRHALALMSSESRVQQTAATFGGTWGATASAQAYTSGGSVAYTSTAGATASVSVTPPQSGPLAGKVFISVFKLAPSVGAMATINVQVDGGAATPVTVSPWENYVGPGGANHNVTTDCIPVTLPVDGAAHTILLTHAGSAGQFMYFDDVLIPSEDPNPIAVMEPPAKLKVGTWNADQIAQWAENRFLVVPDIKEIVAEFGNAFWVTSNVSTNGVANSDGIHLNDRGHTQRCSDLVNALPSTLKARLDAKAIADQPDNDFSVL